ncbi:3-oxoacyl-ACP reductase FabG [Candidatus Schneideria nysicola]|uniref:3-oxoacyl-ACP reductase FabG n=1 Tax=Candidatus Schneideria nysicola TaxID=1081631 RepID=UPI001CAA5C97|nr:3-oxoacyl-ACP reductase FabG [Candidatus Schneideria nysicola]UAJ65168.1 3-oxoacyl-ACP reductase FabG [Candidatus Schneideria nysicola]UAJ66229.1 3-oxoacyl-ACP reductase FabG [Candidatus Schneideria nysicola]
MSLQGRFALVTGASRGIGRAIAEVMVEKGAVVIGTSTSKQGVESINHFLEKQGKGIELNLSHRSSVDAFLTTIQKELNHIDILVNNAGITQDKLLVRMKEEEWQSVLDINLTSIFRLSKEVVRLMMKRRYGRILTIGSVIGSMGNIGQTNYAAAKAGIIGFSKSLAREVAAWGITVNVISPGFITTDMSKKLIYEKEELKTILSRIPIKRFGSPKEVANIVAFFASEEASYITGETIHVNGGMYML